LQFKVSVSTDGQNYTSVLEEPVHMDAGGNRSLRQIDLSPYLNDSEGVFVKIEDKWKEDGLGARFFKLMVVSDSVPEMYALPNKSIQYRFKDRTHPYVIEVVQEDGNRACSSPIWVERKTVPELAWEEGEAEITLVNTGTASAKDITITYDPDEYGYPVASTPLSRLPEMKENALFAWSERVDHRRLRVHIRWYGSTALEGSMQLSGIRGYEVLVNPSFSSTKSVLHDSQLGDLEFIFNESPQDSYRRSVGLDLEVDIDPNQPNRLVLRTKAPIQTIFGSAEDVTKEFVIPLNGRTSDGALARKVIDLKPGGKWSTPAKPGFWAADVEDSITERSKLNNWLELQ
jgi:hypothetical protein